MGDVLRLVHLSDWHLAPLPRVGLKRLISKRALGWFNWYRKRKGMHRRDVLELLLKDVASQNPDVIVVTGDFTNLALDEEFAVALDLLKDLAAIAPLSITPGNHDAYTHGAMPALENFIEQARLLSEGEIVPSPALYPAYRVIKGVAVLMLSSSCPTHLLSSGGHLGQVQRDEAQRLLHTFASDQLPRVVALHHPPYAKQGSLFGKLSDAEAFESVIAYAGAELILHGHWHHTQRQSLVGCKNVHGVASSSGCPLHAEEGASYCVYDIEGKGENIKIEHYLRVVKASPSTPSQLHLKTIK